ncbi:hypothetical protein LPJ73_002014 [Coemansia sp. RSA 2703]|nr:hypothetical protein LPJ73_002014 [Coemansia sp. RSA 2703]KAJ2372349.1 hypothetical protein IW150_004160 [Coemansia sp. RSA 2607]KAJ2396454.1 hypothetical protein GGI05_001107 [Coemansia sp. RSA 2603]
MSQQQTREGDRAGGSAGRAGVGAGPGVEPATGTKEARTAAESAAGPSGAGTSIGEKAKPEDERMAKMERRMDDICALLRDLMVVRQAEQYYAEAEATPTPMGSGERFLQQERPLYSTPSAGPRDHTYLEGGTRGKPVSLPGGKLAAKESTDMELNKKQEIFK